MPAVIRDGKVHRCNHFFKTGIDPENELQCTSYEGHDGDHKVSTPKPKGSPVVNFRVPQWILDAARARANTEGTTVNAVVVQSLHKYGAA